MKDEHETREQLIRELGYLQRRIKDLEKSEINRKRAEEALRESKEFDYILFEHNPIQTIVVDREGKIVRFNLAKKRSGDRLPDMNDTMYKDYAGKHERDMHAELMDCIKSGKTREFPEQKYGDKFISIVIAPFPGGAIITSQDVTEYKRAEEEKERLQAQLIQSEKMAGIGTLTGGIAHEFNNLLQIMRGHTEFAQTTRKDRDMEEALDIVMDSSERASKIIRDLLAFSRAEVADKESSDIINSIETVLSLIENHVVLYNIRVVRKYKRVPRLDVNREEMEQVFLNIITNARDAMLPGGGMLEIQVQQVHGSVEMSFSDTGAGIEEENLSKIFEPFYTTKVTGISDPMIMGTGLGLAVSYGIVKRHGGTIEVESEVGKGTTFTIKLPCIKGKRKEKVIEVEKKKSVKKADRSHILVVDDEVEICHLIENLLSLEGHRVSSVLTGKEAVDLAGKKIFNVVFLDMVMPGISAVEVFEKIKKISPNTRVVMITGQFLDEDLMKKLKQRGVSAFLQKPFSCDDIKEFIDVRE